METPEKYHKYDSSVKWRFMFCPVCIDRFGFPKLRWCCQHHVDRKNNSDRCVWCCSNENPRGVLYEDACHQWIHSNPKEANKLGYYNKLDITYHKKKRDSSKWVIKKKKRDPKKWKINK